MSIKRRDHVAERWTCGSSAWYAQRFKNEIWYFSTGEIVFNKIRVVLGLDVENSCKNQIMEAQIQLSATWSRP